MVTRAKKPNQPAATWLPIVPQGTLAPNVAAASAAPSLRRKATPAGPGVFLPRPPALVPFLHPASIVNVAANVVAGETLNYALTPPNFNPTGTGASVSSAGVLAEGAGACDFPPVQSQATGSFSDVLDTASEVSVTVGPSISGPNQGASGAAVANMIGAEVGGAVVSDSTTGASGTTGVGAAVQGYTTATFDSVGTGTPESVGASTVSQPADSVGTAVPEPVGAATVAQPADSVGAATPQPVGASTDSAAADSIGSAIPQIVGASLDSAAADSIGIGIADNAIGASLDAAVVSDATTGASGTTGQGASAGVSYTQAAAYSQGAGVADLEPGASVVSAVVLSTSAASAIGITLPPSKTYLRDGWRPKKQVEDDFEEFEEFLPMIIAHIAQRSGYYRASQ